METNGTFTNGRERGEEGGEKGEGRRRRGEGEKGEEGEAKKGRRRRGRDKEGANHPEENISTKIPILQRSLLRGAETS